MRHSDTERVEFTVVLKATNIAWQSTDNGKSTTNLMLAAASLTGGRDILASKVESLTVLQDTQDATRLSETITRLPVRLRVPHKTRSVRIVVQTAETGQVGTVEMDSRTLDAAPETSTPEPRLQEPPTSAPPKS